ncbi:MAG: hypothetical protein MOB07_13220 [Acidobacteria bacterium]|nr:hypothetical protein [Acidobacteriota bacterium]
MLVDTRKEARYWSVAYAILFAAFIATGALNMLRVRAGFVTNYVADITVPALLYIVVRGLHTPAPKSLLKRYFGWRPEAAALSILAGSIFTEVSQIYWPAGPFAGRYDPYDIVAYVAGVAVCYGFDKVYNGDKRADQ